MKFYATSCPGCQLIHGARLQERLCTYDRWALLAALQGMDAAGKDGAIKHVVSGINPQGCEVYPFRPPTAEELDHHFLWRTAVRLPERDTSAFSIVPTMKRCWWCGCTHTLWRARSLPISSPPRISGTSALRTFALSSATARHALFG